MKNKVYRFRGYTFYKTSVVHGNTGRYLYEIAGIKELSSRPRPFLLTIQDCREYINEYIRQHK